MLKKSGLRLWAWPLLSISVLGAGHVSLPLLGSLLSSLLLSCSGSLELSSPQVFFICDLVDFARVFPGLFLLMCMHAPGCSAALDRYKWTPQLVLPAS